MNSSQQALWSCAWEKQDRRETHIIPKKKNKSQQAQRVLCSEKIGFCYPHLPPLTWHTFRDCMPHQYYATAVMPMAVHSRRCNGELYTSKMIGSLGRGFIDPCKACTQQADAIKRLLQSCMRTNIHGAQFCDHLNLLIFHSFSVLLLQCRPDLEGGFVHQCHDHFTCNE